MRKSGVILAGAVCFDLGVMFVSGQPAEAGRYLKVHVPDDATACVNNGGTVVNRNGQKYCNTTKQNTPAKR
jgi:hypothetical protein